MNRRTLTRTAYCFGTLWLAGCGFFNAPEKVAEPEVGESTPLETYRAEVKFDPNGRMFLLRYRFAASVTGVHEDYVNDFLHNSGQGFGRMLVWPPTPSSTWIQLSAESQGELWNDGKVDGPVEYDEIAEAIQFPDGTTRAVRERGWLETERLLVSVESETAPSVYPSLTGDLHARMKLQVNSKPISAPNRMLDEFESQALANLRRGDEVVLRETGHTLRVLGAIRARQECLKCHKVEVGTLLGAFTYTLKLQNESTPFDHCLKETKGLSERQIGAIREIESRGGKAIRTPGGGPVSELQMTFSRKLDYGPEEDFGSSPRVRLHDSALKVLKDFPDLEILNVSDSLVSDAGLKTIAELKRLKKLNVSASAVTEDGVIELKKALPDCEIINVDKNAIR